MSDYRKYYYMKLKEDFFDSGEISILESMKNGYLYSNILLKLYLKSLRDGGRLMFNGVIPYNSKMIATITKHQQKTVEKALETFKALGLIDVMDSGAIYMSNIQEYIGDSNSEADRKRRYRERIKEEESKKEAGLSSEKCPDKRAPEIEIEIELELELEPKIEKRNKAADKPPSHSPSSRFSPPSVDEVKAYCIERGNNVDPQYFVDFYTSKGWKVGKDKMKDWKASVRTWEKRNNEERKANSRDAIKTAADYESEDDFFAGTD